MRFLFQPSAVKMRCFGFDVTFIEGVGFDATVVFSLATVVVFFFGIVTAFLFGSTTTFLLVII